MQRWRLCHNVRFPSVWAEEPSPLLLPPFRSVCFLRISIKVSDTRANLTSETTQLQLSSQAKPRPLLRTIGQTFQTSLWRSNLLK